jgi:hypothetical protein
VEAVELFDDPSIFQSNDSSQLDELCIQQSTADSSGPELGVGSRGL